MLTDLDRAMDVCFSIARTESGSYAFIRDHLGEIDDVGNIDYIYTDSRVCGWSYRGAMLQQQELVDTN